MTPQLIAIDANALADLMAEVRELGIFYTALTDACAQYA